ncbi:MAG: hypothetical protein IJV22_08350 [Bacteroidales bacterium]|nr:hypothetical protein [Bacteroidales bacterium]
MALTLGIGLLVTVLYVAWFGQTDYSTQVNMVVGGKGVFSGRQIVWGSAWDKILHSGSLMFGTGSAVNLDGVSADGTASAHNTMLSWLHTLGVVPTLIMLFWFGRMHLRVQTRAGRAAQAALLASMVITFWESFYAECTLAMPFLIFMMQDAVPEGGG